VNVSLNDKTWQTAINNGLCNLELCRKLTSFKFATKSLKTCDTGVASTIYVEKFLPLFHDRHVWKGFETDTYFDI